MKQENMKDNNTNDKVAENNNIDKTNLEKIADGTNSVPSTGVQSKANSETKSLRRIKNDQSQAINSDYDTGDDDTVGSLNYPLLPINELKTHPPLSRMTSRCASINRSISAESTTSHRNSIPLHITVSKVQSTSEHKHKHAFTVFNYGSHDIKEIPASPDSVFSQVVHHHHPLSPVFHKCNRDSQHYHHHSTAEDVTDHDYNRDYKGKSVSESKDDQRYVVTSSIDLDFQKASKHVTIDVPDDGSTVTTTDGIQSSETFHSITKNKSPYLIDVIRRGRIFAQRRKNRLVLKNGEVNVTFINVSKRSLKFFQDIFTTLIDVKWRYLVLVFVLAFLVTWIGFAFIWWGIAAYEIKYNVIGINNGTVVYGDPVCLDGVYNFASAVLFSIETQHTIGYGTRSVTPECPLAIILVMLQSLIGVILACVTTGLIFAKFSRPKYRAETLLFSKTAVICERDGQRCLMFRVGDMRKNHMISVNIRAILVNRHITKEGEDIPFMQHNLHIQSEAEDFFFLAWPIRAIHRIDQSSPLWDLSAEKLLESDFEIVVVFEGTNSSTGQTTQVRTSYLPSEILWGQLLEPLLTNKLKTGQFAVDYTKFHQTKNAQINELSAKDINCTFEEVNMHDKDFAENVSVGARIATSSYEPKRNGFLG